MEKKILRYKRESQAGDFSNEKILKDLDLHRDQYIREWGQAAYDQLRQDLEKDLANRSGAKRVARSDGVET